jgi:uncharacterized protein YbcC (UPF0753/DUF2309 family)
MSVMDTHTTEQFTDLKPSLSELQRQQILSACNRVAPTWPLDEMIAVNPWWEMRNQTFADVSAKLAALSQTQCIMSKAYFQQVWMEKIFPAHLERAVSEGSEEFGIDSLERFLIEDDEYSHWHNVSDFVDSGRDRKYKMAWRDEITHQISQFCADFFRIKPRQGSFNDGYKGLYASWLDNARHDWGIEILMAEDGLTEVFEDLPDHPEDLLALAINGLGIPDEDLSEYSHALYLDINGWSSWISYLRWQDRLDGFDNDLMIEFLAIRMAWEWVLWNHQRNTGRTAFNEMKVMWRQQFRQLPQLLSTHKDAQKKFWIWQRAAEISYQDKVKLKLDYAHQHHLRMESPSETKIRIQAAFCIDVRSEVIRRCLEAQDPSIQTLGFAGFFGLPIEYQPIGTAQSRPQLPGLFKPAIRVKPLTGTEVLVKTEHKLNKQARWTEWGSAPPATFSMVEATGLLYAFKLLKNSLFPSKHHHPVNDLPLTEEFELSQNDEILTVSQKAELAAGILTAMGLNNNLAEKVFLVGHGSETCNNPHAAAYDCGACGGQTGEINVRVLAYILNDYEVRLELNKQGIEIPVETQFIAAMHNTTTDDFTFYGNQIDTATQAFFSAATHLSRQERAVSLKLNKLEGDQLDQAYIQRSKDWSQVRPEWGLAGNASFIVAPRQRTRGLNLSGRAFLHDYDYESDEDYGLLTTIMTAPMVVTNWINLQYYASTCDNHVYGSGNKILHNVVDGSIGVFEGNGGDLRIGLPMQSIHDGENWVHEPLRLSVYIDATREGIEEVVANSDVVKDLIHNDWLYVFRWARDGQIERYYRGHWIAS